MKHALLLVLLSFLCVQGGSARADWSADAKATRELQMRIQGLERTKPDLALAECRAFLEKHPDLEPFFALEVASTTADLCYRLKQVDTALKLCDWALETYKEDRDVGLALAAKARILTGEKRGAEAQELLEKEWERVAASRTEHLGPPVQALIAAIDAQGKRAEATKRVRELLSTNASLLDEWHQGTPPGWMYDRVTKDLLAGNHLDEALGWGKLYFVTCTPTRWGDERAALLLQRLWKIKEMSDRTFADFSAAMGDPTKPNPLAKVKLPELDREAMAACSEHPISYWGDRFGVLNALIATGRLREALFRAAGWYAERPGDSSAEWPKRVLKAAYVNPKPVQDYENYLKTKQGPNPLDELAKKLAAEGQGQDAAPAEQPAAAPKPAEQPAAPPVPQAAGRSQTLGYVKDAADDKRSLTGTGFAVSFDCPGDAHYVTGVRICATRTGTDPGRAKFHLYLLDEKMEVLADLPFPYTTIDTGDLRWYDLDVAGIDVPKQFSIGLDFRPDAQKAIHLGFNRVGKSHSSVGLPAKGYKPMAQPADWMVRVVVSEQARGAATSNTGTPAGAGTVAGAGTAAAVPGAGGGNSAVAGRTGAQTVGGKGTAAPAGQGGTQGAAEAAARPAGQVRVNPKDGAEMVWVPAGEFRMGMDTAELEALWKRMDWNPHVREHHTQQETPAHKVTLGGYWMYRTAVTFAQYQRFLQATGRAAPAQAQAVS